jgi:DNA-binding transcriptional MerR regulator
MKKIRLAEVCRQLDLQPYVLRYWATEFPQLGADAETPGAQKSYTEDEVALLRRIKRLLYEEGFTIAGAKKKLESEPVGGGGGSLFEPHGADEADEAAGDPPAPEILDTSKDERIETLQRGVAKALEEARELLSLLGSR